MSATFPRLDYGQQQPEREMFVGFCDVGYAVPWWPQNGFTRAQRMPVVRITHLDRVPVLGPFTFLESTRDYGLQCDEQTLEQCIAERLEEMDSE